MTDGAERFWSRVNASGVCWEWTGPTTHGYGITRHEGSSRRAHRVAWELLVGRIPPGLVLDHLCRNKTCVNPDHLEPVKQHENVMRGHSFASRNASKTHCPQGHEYTEENSQISNGRRNCRKCRNAPWVCPVCGATRTKRHVTRHLRTHGEKATA